MEHNVIYPHKNAFKGRLAILTCQAHLCDYYQVKTSCVESGVRVDLRSGHTVCSGCGKLKWASGLRECSICDREYINKSKFEDTSNYQEAICPDCRLRHGFDYEEI
jgi:hypothetical protein